MRIRSALFALALVPGALAFAVTPADTNETEDTCTTYSDAGTPEDTSDDIVTCTETQYLSCEETVDPAGKVHDFYNVTTIPLTAEEPTTSFTEGAGCGYPEESFGGATVQDTPFAMDFGDYFTTSIDSLTVELHDLGPWENAIYAANGNEVELGVRLSIDQQSPLGYEENESVDGTISRSPLTLDVPITVELSETGLSSKYVFTVTNILEDLPGLAKEFGDGTNIFSNVLVTIDFPQPVCQDIPESPVTNPVTQCLPSDNVVPVWGASEVPASIIVNGPVEGPEAGTVVDARDHNVNA